MNKIVKVDKPIILKFEDREIKLPKELKSSIDKFWIDAIKENPNLYNGQEYAVETVNETNENIEMIVTKSSYAHYLDRKSVV